MNTYMEKYNQYRSLVAEHNLLEEIYSPLYDIANIIEHMKSGYGYIEDVAKGISSEAIKFAKALVKREENIVIEMNSIAATLLKLDHGIDLGEKIPFNEHYDSGYFRVEEVSIYIKGNNSLPVIKDKQYYDISGLRFRKTGELGKKIIRTRLKIRMIDEF